MPSITAIIITKNEEKNLEDCLASIEGFAERMLVVDSGSIDDTEKIALDYGAEFYYHQFETHAKQRNWAIDTLDIRSKWILRIDADERLTPALITELKGLMEAHEDDDVNGITVGAWLFFMKKKLKHGGARKKEDYFVQNR